MELIELKNKILNSFQGSEEELNEVLSFIEKDRAVYPFNEYELLLSSFIEKKGLTYKKYIEIRTEYINRNPFLYLFEISSPRGFGEKFAQTYIQAKSIDIQTPSKELDKNYDGSYDLWYKNIRIEVKASRVVDRRSEEPLYIKALSRNTQKEFLMNFQQLKPQYCDVFIWLAIFRDEIVIWVLNSSEVLTHEDYSKGQHRGNKGNEGQLHITDKNINTLDKYLLKDNDINKAIEEAFRRKP